MDKSCNEVTEKCSLIDRDASWMKFNLRVLGQAQAADTPLLERVRFSAIFTSNSDEFFRTRIGRLANKAILSQSDKRLRSICEDFSVQLDRQNKIDHELDDELKKNGIQICTWDELTEHEREAGKSFFAESVVPKIFTYKLSPQSSIPFIADGEIAVLLWNGKISKKLYFRGYTFFLAIVSGDTPSGCFFGSNFGSRAISTAELLKHFLPELIDEKVEHLLLFRVIRNADIDNINGICNNNSDYKAIMSEMLRFRDRLSVIRLDIFSDRNDEYDGMIDFLRSGFDLEKYQVFFAPQLMRLRAKSIIYDAFRREKPELYYKPIRKCALNSENLLDKIEKNDILLSFPQHSFDIYLDFLREAIESKSTKSIKMTLYRLGARSKVVALLCAAAVKGIEVTAVIELSARFDERSNIEWSEVLENAGCRVVYGIPRYKVHAKLTLIEQYNGKQFAHIGTGNYNESTAKQYTDLGILTSDRLICADIENLFDNICARTMDFDCTELLVAPITLKSKLMEQIEVERKLGSDGYIFMKLNSLSDPDIIASLTEASKCGVKIELLIRGICCIRPGTEGETENISLHSIVGRYLEHSRIFIFGKNAQTRRTFIGSADMMPRNTERRVEVLVRIKDRQIDEKIYNIAKALFSDNVNTSVMDRNGEYFRVEPLTGEKRLDGQLELFNIFDN